MIIMVTKNDAVRPTTLKNKVWAVSRILHYVPHSAQQRLQLLQSNCHCCDNRFEAVVAMAAASDEGSPIVAVKSSSRLPCSLVRPKKFHVPGTSTSLPGSSCCGVAKWCASSWIAKAIRCGTWSLDSAWQNFTHTRPSPSLPDQVIHCRIIISIQLNPASTWYSSCYDQSINI